jgi:hypothetical protein
MKNKLMFGVARARRGAELDSHGHVDGDERRLVPALPQK